MFKENYPKLSAFKGPRPDKEIKEAMKRDGSLSYKERKYFKNEHINNKNENARIDELSRERLQFLENAYRQVIDAEKSDSASGKGDFYISEKLPLLQEINGIRAHLSYEELKKYASSEQVAQDIRTEMLEMFRSEKEALEEFSKESSDPAIRASIAVRDCELEKMEVDFEMRWIEKKIWDLHTDRSPEKTALREELEKIKNGRLRVVLEKAVSALQAERDLLAGEASGSPRFWYVTGRLAEFERLLGDF